MVRNVIAKSKGGSPRDRLLAAASELFYEHGVHTVGIDTIIERAGVAKASLYSTFGSKDELVRAYLETRAEARRARLADEIDRHQDPTARLLAVFDVLASTVAQPGFRGCAFANAAAESELDSAAADITRDVRRRMLETLTQLARALGVRNPTALARQLTLLYDGALAQSRLDPSPAAAKAAKDAASELVNAALRAGHPRPSRPNRTRGE
jgi:AcrR family transcriptional regulator